MRRLLRRKIGYRILIFLITVILTGMFSLAFLDSETGIVNNIRGKIYGLTNIEAIIKTLERGYVTIELREDGFYPEYLEINKGDTVVFKTTRDKLFWPASNLHPSHTIYSEFDSREPINPEDTWSFRFDKLGKWKYHDHLFPLYRGVIVVDDGQGKLLKNDGEYIDVETCQGADDNVEQCWLDLIGYTIKVDGLDAAFDLFTEFYKNDASFVGFCHEIAHELGGQAYVLLNQGRDFTVTLKTSYCSFGFYHGLVELLFAETGGLKKSYDFCTYISRQDLYLSDDLAQNCYHGIGHGGIDFIVSRNKNLTEEGMALSALELCEEVKDTSAMLRSCISGIFHGITVFYDDEQYGLSVNEEDPLWLCRKQQEQYRETCYVNMAGAAYNAAEHSFSQAAKFIEDIVEDRYAKQAIQTLASIGAKTRINKLSQIESIFACRALEERLRLPCIKGYTFGLFEYVGTGEEYKESLNFCRLETLSEEERTACLKRVFWELRFWYPREKAYQICEAFEVQYREFCHAQVKRSRT